MDAVQPTKNAKGHELEYAMKMASGRRMTEPKKSPKGTKKAARRDPPSFLELRRDKCVRRER